ncbi:sodium-dependent transporter bedraggled isoform X2 [Eupeodes corollae]|uniref:sodium-dependent transporter bedraggled isoform X2 n=1 Tax=Eupeodes corollae TaxID=290404 RepID=UPI0024916DBC|nr:sodium-dependent transporter bedraggled isoform X2 [Eupeodes corollae]
MFSNTSHQGASAYCTLPFSRNKSKDDALKTSSFGDTKRLSKLDEETTLTSSYGTVGRKLRRVIKSHDDALPPYKKLKPESEENENNSSFGLSNNLSIESIQNACEFAELSDDDRPPIFDEQRLTNERRSLRSPSTISKNRNKRKKAENPFCTLRRGGETTRLPDGTFDNLKRDHHNDIINHSSLTLNQEEALNVLNELDAILDNHASSSSMELTSSSEQTEKVEDCLLELDTYLDGLDDNKSLNSSIDCDNVKVLNKAPKRRPTTLPKNMRSSFTNSKGSNAGSGNDSSSLNRGHVLRKTIGSGSALRSMRGGDRGGVGDNGVIKATNNNISLSGKITRSTSPTRKTWRRNSMRKTSLLVLPDHIRSEEDLPTAASASASSVTSEELSSLPREIEDSTASGSAPPLSTPTMRRCISQTDFTPSVLTPYDILQEMVDRNSAEGEECSEDRPRQFGRRADGHPRIFSIRSEATGSGNHCIIINHDRPMSAPVNGSVDCGRRNPNTTSHLADVICSGYIGSEPSSVGSSRNPSPVSLVSSTGSSSIGSTTAGHSPRRPNTPPLEIGNVQPRIAHIDPDNNQSVQLDFNAEWPNSYSRILALMCCTLGLFNISRFANQTIHYGGNFLLQFLLLSVVFGIPLFWLQICLGAKIKAGPVSMWKVSPICRGIGIALVLGQCVMGLYSTVSISWLLVYLKDSFLTKAQPLYRWQESFYLYHRTTNVSGNLTETVADYFNGIVLQRLHLGRRSDGSDVRFQVSDMLAFNLSIIWTIVFLVLCKGSKSFGKVILFLTLAPLILFIVITFRLLYYIGFSSAQNIFSASDFEDFLINSKTWTAAAQEAFLTWGLLGASVISVSSRSHGKTNSKVILRREAILVVLLTLLGLCLAGVFGFSCEQILHKNHYIYVPRSYEFMDSYTSVYSLKGPITPALISFPTKWVPHYSSLLGETYRRPPLTSVRESGYQALRLITELFPAAMAIAQGDLSCIWTALTFFMFILFGLGQLCVMWKPISSGLGNSTSSVLLSCVTALLLGIPFASEMGLAMIHYFDMVFGGAWWMLVLWTAEILAVFLIRGRPYNGDVLVNDLRMNGSMSAFLALSWNVLLPIAMITLAIIEYKVSLTSQFYHWRGKSYFSFWTRKVGGLTQVSFLLIVPVTAIIQIYRYLTNGPPDILDRIQLLYRPTESPLPHRRGRPGADRNRHQAGQYNLRNSDLEASNAQDDAPPKYTPPPSYTTATGARLAKILRQSIRRSVRRFLGEPSRPRPILSLESADNSLPPDYSTVLSNPAGVDNQTENIEIRPRPLYNSYTQRSLSLGRNLRGAHKIDRSSEPRPSSAGTTILSRSRQPYTAFDVANVLRTSTRRRESGSNSISSRIDQSLRNKTSWSVENLVINAAPLGESNAITLSASPTEDSSSDHNPPDMLDNNENTSVI